MLFVIAGPLQDVRLLHRSQWHSDAEHSRCEDCDVAFTFFTRRHHCRLCGFVLCRRRHGPCC